MAERGIFHIEGMHCGGCVARVERAIAAVPGVESAAVNLASGRAHVSFAGAAVPGALVEAVAALGYSAQAPELSRSPDEEAREMRRAALWAGALALPVLVLEMGGHLVPAWHHWQMATFGPAGSGWIQFAFTLAILAGPGALFFRVGLPALWRGLPEMNTLVALGTGAAFLFSSLVLVAPGLIPDASRAIYFESAAIIVAFILLGRWLEARAKGQAGAAVRALLTLSPDTARVERHGAWAEVPLDEVAKGDLIQARPGARIAVDGVVTEGASHVDEAMISGEPVPAHKAPGAQVIGGTVNGSGALVYRATAVGEGTFLAEMARQVEAAQAGKLPIQRVLDRVTSVFVPVVMGIAALTVLVWLLAGGSAAQALVAGVSVLIIACPCAMGLATPVSIMVATGRAAEMGVIFRQADALQRLASVRVMAFDKTGTLTTGRMQVVAAEDAALRMAAAVEALSEHPIAQAIVAAAEARGLDIPSADGFAASVGAGAEAVVNSRRVRVGNAGFTGGTASGQGGVTEVFVAVDGAVLGCVQLSDTIKPGVAKVTSDLRAAGLQLAMLTGDTASAAGPVAEALSIDAVHASVKPAEKAEALAAMEGPVAFVGDGINDAPALAAADVGLAIGTGTDIAIETADVVLQSGDPAGAVSALRLARATMRNIWQNLAWAFGYNVLLIPVAAGVLYPLFGVMLSPALAGGAMALSSVAVVLNALRLRRVRV